MDFENGHVFTGHLSFDAPCPVDQERIDMEQMFGGGTRAEHIHIIIASDQEARS